jgi:hypothetical protein
MDPYLEGELWQEFHDRLANQISIQLMPLLAPKYVALLAKRYVIERPAVSLLGLPPDQRIIYPDVHVATTEKRLREAVLAYGATAVLTPSTEIPSLMTEEIPVVSIEIRDVAERRLVTVIEILSPVNKQGDGAREYAEKRAALLKTQTHIMELDLIRRGMRIQLQYDPPPAPYYAYLSRFQRRPYTQVWAIQLRDQLPNLPVPLLPPDPDVVLEWQTAVNACFDLVGYERLLNYHEAPPPPPFSDEDMAWIRRTISEQLAVSSEQ